MRIFLSQYPCLRYCTVVNRWVSITPCLRVSIALLFVCIRTNSYSCRPYSREIVTREERNERDRNGHRYAPANSSSHRVWHLKTKKFQNRTRTCSFHWLIKSTGISHLSRKQGQSSVGARQGFQIWSCSLIVFVTKGAVDAIALVIGQRRGGLVIKMMSNVNFLALSININMRKH